MGSFGILQDRDIIFINYGMSLSIGALTVSTQPLQTTAHTRLEVAVGSDKR
jgi:hypothetical protein